MHLTSVASLYLNIKIRTKLIGKANLFSTTKNEIVLKIASSVPFQPFLSIMITGIWTALRGITVVSFCYQFYLPY